MLYTKYWVKQKQSLVNKSGYRVHNTLYYSRINRNNYSWNPAYNTEPNGI